MVSKIERVLLRKDRHPYEIIKEIDRVFEEVQSIVDGDGLDGFDIDRHDD